MAERPEKKIKTADTVFDVIDGLQELDGAGVTELADFLDLGTSTVHDYLSTLVAKEYVVKEGTQYRLGLRLLDHGTFVQQQDPLKKYGTGIIDRLAEETSEVAWLVVEEHGKAINLYKALGEHGIVKLGGRVGERSHLHTHASGKAILAHLPRERVDEIIGHHGLPAYTDATLTSKEELLCELETIREEGIAIMKGDLVEGTRGMGSPVVVNDTVFGSIAVTGPKNRFRGARFTEKLRDKILGAANEIELKISYNHSG